MENKELIINLEEMRNDQSEGSLFYAYQCNIAMAFKDEVRRQHPELIDTMGMSEAFHNIANEAAKNFLNLLIK